MNGQDEPAIITDYRDLDVWNESMALALETYKATHSFPKEEMFGITAQMRRAAVSIPSNIAEGYGREQTGSFIQFLRIAQGSLKELETQILLCERIGYLSAEASRPLMEQCGKVGRILRGFIRALQHKEARR